MPMPQRLRNFSTKLKKRDSYVLTHCMDPNYVLYELMCVSNIYIFRVSYTLFGCGKAMAVDVSNAGSI